MSENLAYDASFINPKFRKKYSSVKRMMSLESD
jgi:hypothetical protein